MSICIFVSFCVSVRLPVYLLVFLQRLSKISKGQEASVQFKLRTTRIHATCMRRQLNPQAQKIETEIDGQRDEETSSGHRVQIRLFTQIHRMLFAIVRIH